MSAGRRQQCNVQSYICRRRGEHEGSGRLALGGGTELLLRSSRNTGHLHREAVMLLNSKGQLTIPAHLRAKYGLHAGVEVVEVGGTLQIVRTEGAESRGERLVRRLRNTATGQDVAGMSTDQIMAL